MSIRIYRNETSLECKRFVFPGGEVGIKINFTPLFEAGAGPVKFVAQINNSEDVMALVMMKNAVDEYFLERGARAIMDLYLTYTPYGRQDRVCDKGESFSLKAFGSLIDSLGFNMTTVFDPHSDVTKACFKNLRVISQAQIIHNFQPFIERVLGSGKVFVAPDAGAAKKTSEIAKYFNHDSFVRCEKLRDLSNGSILETVVHTGDFKGADVIVCDDLCDGGRTFTELAKVCKDKGCGKFVLYVTHGIFSKGLDCLYKSGIDEIYTTNSYRGGLAWGCNVLNIVGKFIL